MLRSGASYESYEPMAMLSNALNVGNTVFGDAHEAVASFASGGIDVDFDATVFAHVGVFLVLLIVLKPLLFDPMLALFEERERRTIGTTGAARALDDAAENARIQVETQMAAARAQGAEARAALRQSAAKEEASILSKAREEVEAITTRGRAANLLATQQAHAALLGEAGELAFLVASNALGRKVGS